LKQHKTPVRMCVACREGKPKKELIRIVKSKDAEMPEVDLTGRANGRGAYICPTIECLERAYKTKALSRALDCNMTDEMFEALKRVILRREIVK